MGNVITSFMREWWAGVKLELNPPEKLTPKQAEFMHEKLGSGQQRRMQLALLSSVNKDDGEWGLS